MQISEVNFEKHVYGRTSKRSLKNLEEFDPRPEKYRGTAEENLKTLLKNVHDQGLCISLLLDAKTRCWNEGEMPPLPSTAAPRLPDINGLQQTVKEFLNSLIVSEEEARAIERRTVGQRESSYWFAVRKIIQNYFFNVWRGHAAKRKYTSGQLGFTNHPRQTLY